LILEIREEHCLAVNEVRAASVFMRSSPRVEALWDCIGRSFTGPAANDHDAAGIVRPAFEPANMVIGKLKFAERDS